MEAQGEPQSEVSGSQLWLLILCGYSQVTFLFFSGIQFPHLYKDLEC